MGVPHDGTVSAIDQYLLGSDEPLAAGFIPIASDFSGVTGQVFSERLMTILNTVWQASMATSSIPLGATTNYSAEEYQEAFFPSASRTTTITQEVPVYAANYLFVAILLVVALILQLCAIAGLILKCTATAPDILGYISTMAMENPHVNVEETRWTVWNALAIFRRSRFSWRMSTGTRSKAILLLGVSTMRLISRRVNFPRNDCTFDGLCSEKPDENLIWNRWEPIILSTDTGQVRWNPLCRCLTEDISTKIEKVSIDRYLIERKRSLLIRQITSVSYFVSLYSKNKKNWCEHREPRHWNPIHPYCRSSLTMASILDRGGGISWEIDCELARLKILDQMAIGFSLLELRQCRVFMIFKGSIVRLILRSMNQPY